MDLVSLSTGALWLCGPETSAWWFELPAGTTAVGVRFRPGAAAHVLGLDASAVTNTRVLMTVVDRQLVAGDLINEQRRECSDFERLAALERFVGTRGSTVGVDVFSRSIVDLLIARPRATQIELAEAVGLSVRQLHRRSLRSFGYGTSTLGRLLRFQHIIALATDTNRPCSLADLAVGAGFADQAHLTRDCRFITGQTPSAFLAEYVPTFPDLSDPFKTTPPLSARVVSI
jgi:AraC-like DNA-binding protein